METDWKWDRLDPLERQVAELLLQGKSNAAICAEVFHSRARVQECIKRILIKTGADSTRSAIVLLVEERETLSLLRVLEQARDGVAILQDRVCKFANKALAKLLGYTAEELEGSPIAELLAPEVRDVQANQYELRMRGEPLPRSYTTRAICKTGEIKELTVASAGLVRYKGGPAILVIAADSSRGGGQ
jgi:PAS domain S-box-containing protein